MSSGFADHERLHALDELRHAGAPVRLAGTHDARVRVHANQRPREVPVDHRRLHVRDLDVAPAAARARCSHRLGGEFSHRVLRVRIVERLVVSAHGSRFIRNRVNVYVLLGRGSQRWECFGSPRCTNREFFIGVLITVSMVELTDSLKCLFTGTIEERGDEHVVQIPATEIEHGTIEAGASYRRVALIKREGTATARPSRPTAPRTEPSPVTVPAGPHVDDDAADERPRSVRPAGLRGRRTGSDDRDARRRQGRRDREDRARVRRHRSGLSAGRRADRRDHQRPRERLVRGHRRGVVLPADADYRGAFSRLLRENSF